jgi:hypothetical protein
MGIAAPPEKMNLTVQACDHFRNGFSGDLPSVWAGFS